MNLYEPPKAELAESAHVPAAASKAPLPVKRAVWLIAASLGLGALKLTLVPVHGSLWVGLVIVALLAALTAAIARGANWARIIFVGLFVLGLPGLFFMKELLLQQGPASMAVLAVQTVLQLAAVVLLYLPGSKVWFGKRAAA